MKKQTQISLVLLTAALSTMAFSGCGDEETATTVTSSSPTGSADSSWQLDEFNGGSTGCSGWCPSGYFNAGIQSGNSPLATLTHSFPATGTMPTADVTMYLAIKAAVTTQYSGGYSVFLPNGWQPSDAFDFSAGGNNAISFYVKGAPGAGHTFSGGSVSVSVVAATTETPADCGYFHLGNFYSDISSQLGDGSTWVPVTVKFSDLVANSSCTAKTFDPTKSASIGLSMVVNDAITGTLNVEVDVSTIKAVKAN